MGTANESTQEGDTLAEKLDRLFRRMHPRGREEYTYKEVADGIRQRGGPTISATYIWQLRKGLKDNPTKRHLEALADFFGVSPAYFFDEESAARIHAQLALLAAMRDAQVRHIAMRAADLSPAMLHAIAEIIERTRQIEGLSGPEERQETEPSADGRETKGR